MRWNKTGLKSRPRLGAAEINGLEANFCNQAQ